MCAGCEPPAPGIPAQVAGVLLRPAHPWRWETNEITNGMLRQYFPKTRPGSTTSSSSNWPLANPTSVVAAFARPHGLARTYGGRVARLGDTSRPYVSAHGPSGSGCVSLAVPTSRTPTATYSGDVLVSPA